VVLTSGGAATPATYRGDVVDNNGTVIVDVSSTSTTFTGGLLGNTYGDVYNPTGANKILESGTGNLDSVLTVDTANATTLNATTTNISGIATFTGSSVDFTGTTTMGSWNGPVYDRTGGTLIIEDNASPNPIVHADLDGDVTGTVSSIANHDTGDLTEGSNLYYTDTRVGTYIGGDRTYGNITTTGYVAGPAVFTIDPAGVGDNTGKVVIAGDLQVDGTTTTINSTTLTVDDKNIVLASGSADAATANGAGITVDGANATITYDGTNDEWDFNKDINVTGTVTSDGLTVAGATTLTHNSTVLSVDRTGGATALIELQQASTIRGYLGADSTKSLIVFNGSAAEKFSVSNAGIDVTGTVTADGLTLNNASTIVKIDSSNANARLDFVATRSNSNSNSFLFKDNLDKNKLSISQGGDISFYNSAGTTAKFYWDASEERLGIATDSPTATLQVGNLVSGQTGNVIINSEGGNPVGLRVASRVNRARIQVADNDTSGFIIAEDNIFSFGFADQASNNNLNITNSHNVGIGTTAPTHKLEVAGTTKAEQYLLDAIAKDISDTAVDVFVYDTRKDSDGGAWRKRTQHTSWYNETLNTSTRGSRKEFPAVAVIVTNSDRTFKIYDGDDPDLPLWLDSDTRKWYWDGVNTKVEAKNGIITLGVVGNSHLWSGNGVYLLNLISEKGQAATLTHSGTYSPQTFNLATGILDLDTSANRPFTLVNYVVNDVAMTVLPNAPIDSVTGLPVPTIAVATQEGISVIRDSGEVINLQTETNPGYNGIRDFFNVDFNSAGQLSFNSSQHGRSTGNYQNAVILKYPVSQYSNFQSDYSRAPNSINFGWDGSIISTEVINGGSIVGYWGKGKNTNHVEPYLAGKNIALKTDQYGLGLVDMDVLSGSSALACMIATNHNTGWMNGDIKLATLSDTDDTNVTDANIVTVTSFTAGTGGSVSTSGTQLTITQTSGSNGRAVSPTFSTELGKKYMFTAEGISSSGGAGFRAEVRGPEIVNNLFTGTSYITFDGTGGGLYVELYCMSGVGGSVTYDNILVQEIESDRSVNGGAGVGANGLQVFGTVTKTAMATGADLVGYSGFSSSNYLVQPYNSQLDFGTGDFSITGWINFTGSATRDIITRTDGTNGWVLQSTGKRLRLRIHNSSDYLAYFNDVLQPNVWNHFVVLRRNGYVTAFLNGKEEDSGISDDMSHTVSVNTPLLLSQNSVDKLALLRLSSTAPSAEQIKKIYNDEKFLFQENAKATLYGTSDAVTALAYDDDTNLLHVGTSAGRSVFRGLRRIDNTTDAVGTAISASNGMVAED
jgi:hypothetical protein